MKTAQFSNFEIGVPCGTITTFDWRGTTIDGVYGKFTETDGNIEVFIDDVSYGEYTLSGATRFVANKLGLSSLKKFDGPKFWKIGNITLKEYRVIQRRKQAAMFSRADLEMFYAESTGRLPIGWKAEAPKVA